MAAINDPMPTPAALASRTAQQDDADPKLLAKRRERIRDYEVEALGKSNSLEAVLGACASDLMMGMLYLRESMEQAWGEEFEPLEQLSQLLPCLDQLGKVSKQLESLVELQLSLQDRRLLAKDIRLQRKASIRSKKKRKLIVQGTVSPADNEAPSIQRSEPKKPR